MSVQNNCRSPYRSSSSEYIPTLFFKCFYHSISILHGMRQLLTAARETPVIAKSDRSREIARQNEYLYLTFATYPRNQFVMFIPATRNRPNPNFKTNTNTNLKFLTECRDRDEIRTNNFLEHDNHVDFYKLPSERQIFSQMGGRHVNC